MESAACRARWFFRRCRASRFPPIQRRSFLGQSQTPAVKATRDQESSPPKPDDTAAEPIQSDASPELQRPYTWNRDNKKPYYVTSPIFYVNAAPHVGHLYTLILTDIFKRWEKLKKDDRATLLTGTDEHGMKIQKAAMKSNLPPKAFCDHHAKQFEDLARAANVDFDRFIRTTDDDHKSTVEHFWRELNHRGYIYESKHEGWYSVSDETFYPESQIHLVLEPETGRKMYASMETGKEVEWTSEINYRFKLSDFQKPLLKHYKDNPHFISPKERMNFIVNEVESGLTDLSISRPSSRLTWGIPVPNDPSQTVYVWLDALLNYLTMTGYPNASPERTNPLWPPNVQVIGKDIIRFHTIYWPAFLMAVDLPLPKKFLCHAHWTMNREKMSKSLGNVVDPFLAIQRFGLETIRFFMAHDGGIVHDADYDNSFIVKRYKKSLQGGFGNLVSRVVRGKLWNVRESVKVHTGNGPVKPTDVTTQQHIELIRRTPGIVEEYMHIMNPRSALHQVMHLIYETNKYFHEAAVWDLTKTIRDEPETQARVKEIIFVCSESIRVAAILMQPYMPSKMSMTLDWLGVKSEYRTFYHAKYAADPAYGRPFVDPGKGPEDTIFPPLVNTD